MLLILLLLFGAKKLPQLARDRSGQAGKEFKSGLKEGYKEPPLEGPCPFCKVEVPPESKFCPGCGKSRGRHSRREDAPRTRTESKPKSA